MGMEHSDETISILDIPRKITSRLQLTLTIHYADATKKTVPILCRIDTVNEANYYNHAGILHYVLRTIAETKNHD